MTEPLHSDEALMKYLDGDMGPAEKAMFEGQVQQDTDLKQRLQSLRLAIASVQQYGTAEKVKTIHKEMVEALSPVQQKGKLVSMQKAVRYSLAVAASIIVILVGVNLFTSYQLSSEKLYREAFVDFNASAVRGNENVSAVTKLYREGNYRQVKQQVNAKNLSQRDSLLVGLSYLKSNEIAPAADWFRAISLQNPFKQDAEFYLSLALLKNKNYQEALQLMKQIYTNSGHIYHGQFSEDYINKVEKLASK